jgi:hypothetical protein
MKIYIPLLVLILCLACEKDPTIPLGKGNFPNIATIDISAIIGSTALSGVQINSIPTNYILQEKGICWALSPNPTTDNHALSISPSANGQINLRDLIPNTKYYARAYGKFNNTYYYGPEVSFTSANQEVSLSNGLVAYFPLNGSSVDFSSSKNNMTGNAIYGSGRKGIKNTAVSFNGTSSYYLRVASPINLPTGNSPYTMSFWFYSNNWKLNAALGGYGISNVNLSSNYLKTITTLGFNHYHWNFDKDIAIGLYPNAWTHLVVTYDGSSEKYYINSTYRFLWDHPTVKLSINPTVMSLGCRISLPPSSGILEFFNGYVDEFRIYNRALSQSEVTTLYNY